jgi:hypothetical protein
MEPVMNSKLPKPNTDSELLDILVELDLADASPSLKKILEPDSRKSLHVQKAKARLEALIASKVEEARIEPFDFVESCEPDCTPERHAYHQGQWEMAQRIKRHYGYEEYPGGEALQSREQDKV